MPPRTYRDLPGRSDLPAHDSTVSISVRPFQWIVLAGLHARLAQASAPDWAHLDQDAHAHLVKANPLRRVYRISWADLDAYAKTYQPLTLVHRLKWIVRKSPARNEFHYLRVARARGVPAPRPLAWATGRVAGHPVAILLTESLGPTRSLEDLLYQSDPAGDPDQLRASLAGAARLLARLHCAGIFHRDLHPGNILLPDPLSTHDPLAYVTDLYGARFEQRSGYTAAEPFRRDRLANTAVLVACLRHRLPPNQVEHFLASYLQAVQPHQKLQPKTLQDFTGILLPLADRHDRRVNAARDRRARRRSRYCGPIRPHTEWSGLAFLQRKHPLPYSQASAHQFTRDLWEFALADPQALIAPGRILKQGNRNAVVAHTLTVGDTKVPIVVKHTRAHTGFRGHLDAILLSRAARQWDIANALVHRKFPTAFPLVALDHRPRLFSLVESLFITEEIPHATDLYHYLQANAPLDLATHRGLTRDLAFLLADLRREGFTHRDCKATNILVQHAPDQPPALFLIDLDGLKRRRLPLALTSHEALIRLGASLHPARFYSRTDAARFLRHYLARLGAPESTDRTLRHRLGRDLAHRIEHKAAHQRSFPSPKGQEDSQ